MRYLAYGIAILISLTLGFLAGRLVYNKTCPVCPPAAAAETQEEVSKVESDLNDAKESLENISVDSVEDGISLLEEYDSQFKSIELKLCPVNKITLKQGD